MLIVVVLFLATARVIASIQGAEKPRDAVDVVVVGHQYWWEYRYPKWDVVTANELHVPVSDPSHPTPTFLTLLSADTVHSFWVPRLAGKTDLIPNHPNTMWIDPHETGLYLGQCAQYCGTQHAKMLLRVYVDSREDFDRWIEAQRQPARTDDAVVSRPARVRVDRVRQLPRRRRHAGGRPLRPRPDALHEPRDDRVRRGGRTRRRTSACGSGTRTRSNRAPACRR